MAQKYLKLAGVLKRLLFERNMKPIDLAREVNIPAPTIHRLITGKSTRPYKSSIKPIADYFCMTVDELMGEEIKKLTTENSQANLSSRTIIELPVIPWQEVHESKPGLKTYEKIPFVGHISEKGYATHLLDHSMEPLFLNGSLLILDPEKIFKDRSYVLVQLSDTDFPVFRQILIDTNQKYLKALHPDLQNFKMRLIGKKDKILATLVESRHAYNEY